jgi:hypothetical protein
MQVKREMAVAPELAVGRAMRRRRAEGKRRGDEDKTESKRRRSRWPERKEGRVEQGKLARRADNAIRPVSDSRSSRRPSPRLPWPRECHRSTPSPRPAGHHRPLGPGWATATATREIFWGRPACGHGWGCRMGGWVPPWRGAVCTAVAVVARRQVPATVTAGESTRPREQEAIFRYRQPPNSEVEEQSLMLGLVWPFGLLEFFGSDFSGFWEIQVFENATRNRVFKS